jgi:hypothetical protein
LAGRTDDGKNQFVPLGSDQAIHRAAGMFHKLKLPVRRKAVFAAALGTILATGAASAHHALEAVYDTSTEVEGTATLTQVQWINPHAWMRFDFRYANGSVDKDVMLETLSISGLRALGVDKDALKVGFQYLITYYPNRDGTPGGFMTKMVLPSGTPIAAPSYDYSDEGDAP